MGWLDSNSLVANCRYAVQVIEERTIPVALMQVNSGWH
jgi:hypothetical protein